MPIRVQDQTKTVAMHLTSIRPDSMDLSVRRLSPSDMPVASGGPTTQENSPLTFSLSWRVVTNCREGQRGAVSHEHKWKIHRTWSSTYYLGPLGSTGKSQQS